MAAYRLRDLCLYASMLPVYNWRTLRSYISMSIEGGFPLSCLLFKITQKHYPTSVNRQLYKPSPLRINWT